MSTVTQLEPLLKWEPMPDYPVAEQAQLGTKADGVFFSLVFYPSCHRRGRFRLIIEVCGGFNHHKWGCFDDADQPIRNFHKLENAKSEAEEIAKVLWVERRRLGD
jgi:hypothetical protein